MSIGQEVLIITSSARRSANCLASKVGQPTAQNTAYIPGTGLFEVGLQIYIYIVRTSSSQCACVTCVRRVSDLNTVVGEGKERESVVPANLCIVVGCAIKRARG